MGNKRMKQLNGTNLVNLKVIVRHKTNIIEKAEKLRNKPQHCSGCNSTNLVRIANSTSNYGRPAIKCKDCGHSRDVPNKERW